MKIYQVNENSSWFKQNQLGFIIHTEKGIFQKMWITDDRYEILETNSHESLTKEFSNLIYTEEE